MAKIGVITVTMEQGDSHCLMTVGESPSVLAGGISFFGVALWTRRGYDTALEDCDRLIETVVKLKRKLRECKAELEAGPDEEEKDRDLHEVDSGGRPIVPPKEVDEDRFRE